MPAWPAVGLAGWLAWRSVTPPSQQTPQNYSVSSAEQAGKTMVNGWRPRPCDPLPSATRLASTDQPSRALLQNKYRACEVNNCGFGLSQDTT
jgi:hypothetical protein